MRRLLPAFALVGVLGTGATASAAEYWVGDFETGDTSQYNFVLNGNVDGTDYITIVQDEVAQGSNAARIELHNDAVWPNGLKRVELQHRADDDARTAEGATTYFAWSIYLPQDLPDDPSQTIGYWESTNSFQQVMAFTVAGQNIRFVTRRPNNVVHWDEDGVVTPGQWHRIAMRVLWSTDVNQGEVDVWFDGTQVVDAAEVQTLADGNPHFAQFGLLRGAIEFSDVPVIYVDDAVEGDSLEDVRFDELPTEGGTTGGEGTGGDDGGSTSGADTTTGTTTTTTTGDSGATTSGTTAATSTTADSATGADTDTDGAGQDADDSGCSCTTNNRAPGPHAMLLLMVGALALRRRPA